MQFLLPRNTFSAPIQRPCAPPPCAPV